jgi:hypothetical protein
MQRRDRKLAKELKSLAADVEDDTGDTVTKKRRAALADTLNGIAARLR